MEEKIGSAGARPDLSGPFGGRGVRHPRRRDRSELEAFARQGASEPLGTIDGFEDLVRDAEAMRPARLEVLRQEMARLEDEFRSLGADDRLSAAEWTEAICRPWVLARVPLRGRGLEPSWAVDFLLALLADFDRSGQVVTNVDPAWRRCVRESRDVAATARLALAAGWISWSHLIVDPALAGAALTLAGELLDRLDALAHGPGSAAFDAEDRGWTLAALALERRMLRHWRWQGGSVH